MVRHVLRNALIPILTNVVVAIPFLFTGALLLESFFGIPGLGALTVEAIQGNDFSTLRTMVYSARCCSSWARSSPTSAMPSPTRA